MNTDTERPVFAAGKSIDVAKWLLVVALLTAAVVGNAWYAGQPLLYRVVAGVLLVAVAVAVAMTTVKGHQFNAFRREALIELRKIVWPTQPETRQTTLIVFVVVAVMAVVLYLFDLSLGWAVSKIIG